MNRFLTAFVASMAIAGAGLCQAPQKLTPFMRMVKPSPTREVLQTKARRYTAPDGKGPDVWLVGVAHIGGVDYYKAIQQLLDSQTSVLFEGVTRKGTDPTASSADPK